MRIGLYTPSYPGITTDGGIGSYVCTLGKELVRSGHTIHILTPSDTGDIARAASELPASDGPLGMHYCVTNHLPGIDKLIPGAGASWRVYRAAARLIVQHKLDIFEFPNWEGYGLLPALHGRVPVVVRLHTSAAEAIQIDHVTMRRWDRWTIRRENWLTSRAAAVVTHTDAHRRAMVQETGLTLDRIRLIPHGIEVYPEFVRPERAPGPPTVVSVGRLEHRKGTVELLQAVPLVLQQVPDARFVLIGADRPHAPGGRTHADYLNQDFPPHVRAAVTLTGRLPQPDVDRWLQTADLFVTPSRYESFGLVFLEAMRWGTPVIGTVAGGIPEVVEHGTTGLLVPPENPGALAAAIIQLLTSHGAREAFGASGRRRAETEFAASIMAKRMAAFYEEAIAGQRSRA
jgi:hypothetical protein